MTELAESIKTNGILQNLTVVPDQETGEYTAVIGHRRLAAAKLAGLTEVPCVVSEMSHKQQVSTMLLENMQRSDLTIYEQAQGFQMMINFGDTVGDIAGRTGFSETTVRRRVKLLDLDSDKFKKSVERGATLMDYAELDKIKDPQLKNEVLDKIGTSNFRYDLERAVSEERAEENKAKLLEQLEQFATLADSGVGMQYIGGYYPSRDDKVSIPDDSDTVEYFYVISSYGITLYARSAQGDADTEVSVETERRRKRQERGAALDEVTGRAYKLRGDFIRGISSTRAANNIGVIIQYSLRGMLESYLTTDTEDFVEFLGDEVGIGEGEEFEFDGIVSFIDKQPERSLLIATYLAHDSKNHSYYDWSGQYEDSDELNTVYDFLEEMGYQISDEEQAMRDGTHELFADE